MILLNENDKISVELLKSRLLARRATKETFSIPITHQQACDALTAAVQAEIESRRGKFQPSRDLNAIISQVAQWLIDPNHKCGLLMCGTPGNGKTTMMNAIGALIDFCDIRNERGQHMSVTRANAKSIAQQNKQDYEAYKRYFTLPMLAIDDMGFEPAEVMSFGNVLSPLVDLFEQRYNNQLFTLVTTNLTPKEITERYGERIADRFREMMCRIIFKSKSYRQ